MTTLPATSNLVYVNIHNVFTRARVFHDELTLLTVGELCLTDEVSPLQLLHIPHLGRPIIREGGKECAVLEHLDPGIVG